MIRTISVLVPLLLLTLVGSAARADESVSDVFQRGQEAYLAGRHLEAVAAYESLVSAGVDDADVYFNLGVAQMAADKPGYAVLNLERALRVRASDSEARRTLRLIRQELTRREANARGEATLASDSSVLEAAFRPFSSRSLEVAALGLWTATFLLLIALQISSREASRIRIGILITSVGLGAAVFLTGLAVRERWFEDGAPAIFVAERGSMRQGPDARTDIVGTIATGSPCRVLQSDTAFVEVQNAAGTVGWIPQGSVETIHR